MTYSASNIGVTLKSGLGGRSRSLKMAPFNRSLTSSYSSSTITVTVAVSCAVSEINRNIGRKANFSYLFHLTCTIT